LVLDMKQHKVSIRTTIGSKYEFGKLDERLWDILSVPRLVSYSSSNLIVATIFRKMRVCRQKNR
jgi:hypothetical protein